MLTEIRPEPSQQKKKTHAFRFFKNFFGLGVRVGCWLRFSIRKAKQPRPMRGSTAEYIDVFSDDGNEAVGGKENPNDASDHSPSEEEDVYCEKCGEYVAEGEKELICLECMSMQCEKCDDLRRCSICSY